MTEKRRRLRRPLRHGVATIRSKQLADRLGGAPTWTSALTHPLLLGVVMGALSTVSLWLPSRTFEFAVVSIIVLLPPALAGLISGPIRSAGAAALAGAMAGAVWITAVTAKRLIDNPNYELASGGPTWGMEKHFFLYAVWLPGAAGVGALLALFGRWLGKRIRGAPQQPVTDGRSVECLKCGFNNFPHRVACKNCGEPIRARSRH